MKNYSPINTLCFSRRQTHHYQTCHSTGSENDGERDLIAEPTDGMGALSAPTPNLLTSNATDQDKTDNDEVAFHPNEATTLD